MKGFEVCDIILTVEASTHRQVEFDGIHRRMKGPGELVFPQALQHHLEQILQLIGLALWPVEIDVLWGWRVEHFPSLPLAAATARHLCCIQAVPHFNGVGRGLRPLRGSWS